MEMFRFIFSIVLLVLCTVFIQVVSWKIADVFVPADNKLGMALHVSLVACIAVVIGFITFMVCAF